MINLPGIRRLEQIYGQAIIVSARTGKAIEETLEEKVEKELPDYVWVAYSDKPPYLPVAVADSASKLAAQVGTTTNTVESCWSKYRAGKIQRSSYQRVHIVRA